MSRATALSRTARAVHPGELASAGMSSHMTTSTPATPTTAPATRSPWRSAAAAVATEPRVQRAADRRARAPARRSRRATTNASDASRRVRGRRAAERVGDVGDEQRRATHDPEREAGPRRDPAHEPEPVADPAAHRRRRRATTRSRKFTPPARAAARG